MVRRAILFLPLILTPNCFILDTRPMHFEISSLFVFFLTSGLLGIMLLWLYYDFREKESYVIQKSCPVFHCLKCGHIYHKYGQIEESVCPQCQFNNQRLKF